MHLCVECGRLFRGRDDWNKHAKWAGEEHRWTIVRLVELSHCRELTEAAQEFLDAYVDSERTIAANDIERLDEAEIKLRAALSSAGPGGGKADG